MMRPFFVTAVAFLTPPLLLFLDGANGADPRPQHADTASSTSTLLRHDRLWRAAASASLRRALQGGGPDLEALADVCDEETGQVRLAENLAALLGSDTLFQPSCTCSQNSNVDDDFGSSFGDVSGGGFDIDLFNELISNLFIDISWSCDNQCATCHGDVCGILSADYAVDFTGTPTNFTLEDLFSGAFAPDAGLGSFLQGSQTFQMCMEYVSGDLAGTTACLSNTFDLETLSSNNNATEQQPCTLSYQGQDCDSCALLANGCWSADCSVHGVPVVDSCANTGMDGIFQVLAYYTGAVDSSTLTVGGSSSTCAVSNNSTNEQPATCSADRPCVLGNTVCVPDPDSVDCVLGVDANDCPGVCVAPPFCAGVAGIECPPGVGLTCADDPNDDCDPATGGADCGGICIEVINGGGGAAATTDGPTPNPSPSPLFFSTDPPVDGTGTPVATAAPTTSTSPVTAPTTDSPVSTTTQSPVGTSSTADGVSNTNAPTDPPVSAAAGSMLHSQWVVMVAAAAGALLLLSADVSV